MAEALGQDLVVVVHLQAGADLRELLAEDLVGTADAADHAVLAEHDDPRLDHHRHQHQDDHPGVDRHGLEQKAQAAETKARLFFIHAIGQQFRLRTLGAGIGQQRPRRACDFGQAQLIHRPGKGQQAAGGLRQVGANGQLGIERRHRQRQGRGFAAVDIQGHGVASGRKGQVLPLAGVQRLGRYRTLAVDLDKRHALVQAQHQAAAAFTAGQHHLLTGGLVQAQPGTESKGAAGGVLQRRTGRQQQRLAAELQGPPDHAVDARTGGVQRGVAIGRGVTGRRAVGALEMVERGVARIERQLAVAGRRGLVVAVVHPQVLTLAALDLGHIDPDQRHAHQRVEALDLMIEHGLVVGADKTQVGAVFLDPVEGEVAGVQAHQQGSTAQRLIDRGALGGGVQRDLFTVVPVVLPPGLGGGREHEAQADQQAQK